MTEAEPPLLEAEDLRVDVGGAVALERATFSAGTRALALLGEVAGLLAALAGAEPIRSGTLRLAGLDVGSRAHQSATGLAPLDPPLPPKWTALEYATWSARLSGLPRRTAIEAARRALADIGIGPLERAVVGSLGLPDRRVLVLAHAIVASPRVVVASMPLAGLAAGPAEYVLRAFERATRDRAFVASVSRADVASPEHAIAASADELLVFAGGRLVRRGKVAADAGGGATFRLTVRARAEELAAALAARGIAMRGGPVEFWVEVPEGGDSGVIVAAAAEVGAAVVRMGGG